MPIKAWSRQKFLTLAILTAPLTGLNITTLIKEALSQTAIFRWKDGPSLFMTVTVSLLRKPPPMLTGITVLILFRPVVIRWKKKAAPAGSKHPPEALPGPANPKNNCFLNFFI